MEMIFDPIYTISPNTEKITILHILELIKDHKIEFIDLKFTDLFGRTHHYTQTADMAKEELFKVGTGFDGSSIRGYQSINQSDMLMRPDPTTAFIDPFFDHRTMSFFCDIIDPVKRVRYPKDPRYVAYKTLDYLIRQELPTRPTLVLNRNSLFLIK